MTVTSGAFLTKLLQPCLKLIKQSGTEAPKWWVLSLDLCREDGVQGLLLVQLLVKLLHL